MKILEANVSALTNFEVLDFLRAKGASKDPTRVIANVSQSEYKVYDYLVDTAASVQTRENINEFLTRVKRHDLAEAEVLNILNIRPAAEVEIFPIIEVCEQRFSDEEVTEIVELVKKTLPPPVNMNPGEITKDGDEETAAMKNEKDNEISQDQDEGGEQMDTS
ncbi:DNA-directed RNA polymerase III subunit RPC9-like [Abrus precatorius]|uniref:DNA-directed RNA polymerase III subunit RPC9 n=1 Tax=Abrus precatorius TaxID=3816 RepID=A0A8B8LS72_ABRPR|nr:DNA-directed RNA polymerase III subunit RPC9-like [Abrus precatorius]